MNILIIGGSGYIGENIINNLMVDNEITIGTRGMTINTIKFNNNVKKVFFDVTLPIDKDIFQEKDVLIYLTSTTNPYTSNLDYIYDIKTNLISSIEVFKAAAINGIKKIIFASSGGAIYKVDNEKKCIEKSFVAPNSSYGIIKLATESYLQLISKEFGINYKILRISNPYGSTQNFRKGVGVISAIVESAIKKNEIQIWGDGLQIRDFLHISDLVNVFRKSIYSESKNNIYNIGKGESFSIKEIIEMVENILGYKLNVSFTLNKRFCDMESVNLDISLAIEELNWIPKVTMKNGLIEMIESFNIRKY